MLVTSIGGGAVVADDGRSGASSASRSFASPQSITTVSPNAPMRTLLGLRSRWMTRSLCAYAMASATASTFGKSSSRCSSVARSAIASRSDCPCTSFIAKNGSPESSRPISCTGMIDGCCSRAVSIASRTNRA